MTFLKINNLSVNYEMRRETVYAAKKVNINVEKGEILGLVGESGSGKSTIGNAIINLIDEPGKVSGGSIILDGMDIYENPEKILKLRGKKKIFAFISRLFLFAKNSYPYTNIAKCFINETRNDAKEILGHHD